MVRLGLDNRGGESSCSSRSGGSGVRVSARPAIFVPSRCSRYDRSIPKLGRTVVQRSAVARFRSDPPTVGVETRFPFPGRRYGVQSISKTVYPLETLTLFLGPYPSMR
jgi:hypothetical protein